MIFSLRTWLIIAAAVLLWPRKAPRGTVTLGEITIRPKKYGPDDILPLGYK